MIEIQTRIPSPPWPVPIPLLIEKICAEEGLAQSLKGTLARYPNCLHWHYKKDKRPGTLEITWWEQENRLWFKVAAGRRGDWIAETIDRLNKQIENALNLKR